MARKIRKDARCHGDCGLLRSECWCGWHPRKRSQFFEGLNSAGRPRKEHLYTEHELWSRDDDAPAWFKDAMIFNEKLLTVKEFARKFGSHPTQIRRWIDLGLIHVAWTRHAYREDKKHTWTDDGVYVPAPKSHVSLRRYTFHRWLPGEEMRPSHRRIPISELERCQFLKNRYRGCGRDPRFKGEGGEAPSVPNWHAPEKEINEEAKATNAPAAEGANQTQEVAAQTVPSPVEEIDLSVFEG